MIKANWHPHESHIILLDYSHPVHHWDEYDQAVDESHVLAQGVTHHVYIVHNAGRTRMPPGNAFLHLKRALDATPANVQAIFAVVNNRVVADIMTLTFRVLIGKGRLILVSSLAEAEQRIAQQHQPVA
jgi:hypothetical protein